MTSLDSQLPRSAPVLGRRHTGPHVRILLCLLAGLLVALALPDSFRATTRALLGWNASALLFMAFTLGLSRSARYPLRDLVSASDQGRLFTLAASVIAAAISLAAVLIELMLVKKDSGMLLPEHIALTVATVLTTWAFVHFKFAIHYANQYFNGSARETGDLLNAERGLDFPGDPQKLALSDFLYFSFVIGLANSTADVSIRSRSIRITALCHGIYAFFFNMTVLGLTVSLVSGLF